VELIPFHITVPPEELDDLHVRLSNTRWADTLPDVGWDYGTDPVYLRSLLDYWRDTFDWRPHERDLNSREHYLVEVAGLRVHVVRAGQAGGIPVLLLHGWPGSFVQMLGLSDRLAAAGGFEVVVASLPGFAWSDPAKEPGMSERRIASLMHALMTDALGHRRYAVRGSDFGAGVASEMAIQHPEAVIGLHLSGTTPAPAPVPADATPAEREYLDNVTRWRESEVGYAAISSTRPHTLAVALADSPAGTASWILEKLRRWSDCDGDVEKRFTKDQLLLNISVYWFTNTIGSSIGLYRESRSDTENLVGTPDVPTAHLMSRRDMFPTPREWLARTSRMDRYVEVDCGGHFLEWEEPDLVSEDLQAFLRPLANG
jgi:pimeloyl-ACP methyl ester carboxylesterase